MGQWVTGGWVTGGYRSLASCFVVVVLVDFIHILCLLLREKQPVNKLL